MVNPKTGIITEYKFSYDQDAYYFQLQRLGVGEQQLTLALPVCHSIVKLVEEYSCNMDGLVKRLKVDKKTGQLFIKNFKRNSGMGNTAACRSNIHHHSADSLCESTAGGISPLTRPAVPQTTTTSQRKIDESSATTSNRKVI